MKDQWKQGLQWGAVAAVAWWIAPYLVTPFYMLTGAPASIRVHYALCTAIAVPIAALIAITWSKVSRVAVLVLLAVSLWQADPMTSSVPVSPAYALVSFVFWHAAAVQFLPLLLVTPERPRVTVALALVGRWREALETLSGFRWIAVAAGVFSLDKTVLAVCAAMYAKDGALRCNVSELLAALAPSAILFGLAALPRLRATATA